MYLYVHTHTIYEHISVWSIYLGKGKMNYRMLSVPELVEQKFLSSQH